MDIKIRLMVCFGLNCWSWYVQLQMRVKLLRNKIFVRLSFGLGAIPILVVLYFRKYIEEAIKRSPHYLLFQMESLVEQFVESLLYEATCYTLILALIGIPGAVLGAFTIDKLGRKWQQVIGFIGSAIFGIIIGGAYDKIKSSIAAIILLYGVFNFFLVILDQVLLWDSYQLKFIQLLYEQLLWHRKADGAIGIQVFLPIMNHFGGESSINGPCAVFIISGGLSLLGALLHASDT
eukprot:jgi/Galph1/1102/GphlegSOOS_G5918.1